MGIDACRQDPGCTEIAVASVTIIYTVGGSGSPAVPDSVVYSYEGGHEIAAQPIGDEPYTEFVAGWVVSLTAKPSKSA